jgi:hypothetical protein
MKRGSEWKSELHGLQFHGTTKEILRLMLLVNETEQSVPLKCPTVVLYYLAKGFESIVTCSIGAGSGTR